MTFASLRWPAAPDAGSFNARLVGLAADAAGSAGAEVTRLDLRSLALPLYDAEIEAAGLPDGALELRRLLAVHDGLLVSSPEYNGFPTPLLVNAFDWASRVGASGDLPAGLAAMAGKVAGVMSASPGPLGGIRSLGFARQFMHNTLGMLVVPEQFALPLAGKAFDEGGRLIDPRHAQGVQRVVDSVLRLARALKGRRQRRGQAHAAELPLRLGREEVAVAGAHVARGRGARAAAQHVLVAHELAVVFADGARRRAVARVGA